MMRNSRTPYEYERELAQHRFAAWVYRLAIVGLVAFVVIHQTVSH